MCSVIRFLNAKDVKPAEIHHQLVDIYGANVMTVGIVKKWVRQFNSGPASLILLKKGPIVAAMGIK